MRGDHDYNRLELVGTIVNVSGVTITLLVHGQQYKVILGKVDPTMFEEGQRIRMEGKVDSSGRIYGVVFDLR